MKLAHIINPVKVKENSDLYDAQPITFETIKNAKSFAESEDDLEIDIFTTQYSEDREIIPEYFTITDDLEKSVLDIAKFNNPRKLPLIRDILDRLNNSAPKADYLIYSNSDIAVMPNFYLAIKLLIDEGYDSFSINRRVIEKKYYKKKFIPLMCAMIGQSHPGLDCFVFKKDYYNKYHLDDICIGARYIGKALEINAIMTSENYKNFKNYHLTFHLGNDRVWDSNKFNDYALHNQNELKKIKKKLNINNNSSKDRDTIFRRLMNFIKK